jgi:hypothetical protein
MISKTPRMVGRSIKGMQIIPMMLKSPVRDNPSPQKRLTTPLARVIHAMTFTKVGFGSFVNCVFISFS